MIRRIASLLLVLAVVPQPFAFAWGNDGHILINRTAALKVPTTMPLFLRQASERLAYLGPEPDRWRSRSEYAVKNAQEPDHFIDMERLEGLGDLPEGRYEYYRLLYERRATAARPDDLLPERVGLQPYITMEVYGRLKVAFREYRQLQKAHKSTMAVRQNIVFYAGWLGHYVADGANPLHTTVQYNGWTGDNPRGFTTSRDLHGKFESAFVKQNLANLRIAGLVKPPVRLQSPFKDYMAYLRETRGQVEQLYELEKTGAFDGAGTPAGVDFVRQSFARGTQMLLNMWYTAWLESAELPPPR